MYVVLRRSDTGDTDTLAVFDYESEADELARLVNERDGSTGDGLDAYSTYVEFTPRETDPARIFRDLFDANGRP